MNNNVNEELKILWRFRDMAKDDNARITAQSKIDEYFFGKPEKKDLNKKKKKKTYVSDDEWDEY